MARRSRNRNRSGRDVSTIAKRSPLRLPRFVASPVLSAVYTAASIASPPRRPRQLRLLEDRRTFHPDRLVARPAFSFPSRSATSIVTRADPRRVFRQTKARLGFAIPRQVLICVRRKARREVLFARGVGGAKGLRPPRRNFHSSFSCR